MLDEENELSMKKYGKIHEIQRDRQNDSNQMRVLIVYTIGRKIALEIWYTHFF